MLRQERKEGGREGGRESFSNVKLFIHSACDLLVMNFEKNSKQVVHAK